MYEMLGGYEGAADAVATAVWERWTGNGNGLDADDREQTMKSVNDAVNNVWTDGMSVTEWQDAALAWLYK